MRLGRVSIETMAVDTDFTVKKHNDADKIIALCGNPNVGKSTIFNELTGLNQHTGNWPGKTVTNAQGYYRYKQNGYILVDLPGCYSLMARSAEEEAARDFICYGNPDAVIIVCDGTCLERNLNLVLQTIEITKNVVVCVNLIDEAKKKGIDINFNHLSKMLGVPVIPATARSRKGLVELMEAVDNILTSDIKTTPIQINYPKHVERLLSITEERIDYKATIQTQELVSPSHTSDNSEISGKQLSITVNKRWFSLASLYYDYTSISNHTDEEHNSFNITKKQIREDIVSSLVKTAENIFSKCVSYSNTEYKNKDIKIDKFLTGKWTAFPIMIVALLCIFWLTISGANYPSQLFSRFLFWVEDKLFQFALWIGIPNIICEMLIHGVYRVLSWVVSVMLPPMAIFFPLFSLLEDSGFLPRIAFNLDKCFKKCNACGKQALTMCMGFGCNAVGIIGCRIIDSKRERLIAILTNCFVPCNGRFPALIAVITMFFVSTSISFKASFISALLLTTIILLGIAVTFLVSKILSKTILKGMPSSFTLELPPYRRPQIIKTITRSIFDKTLLVLSRAVSVAAPTGLLLWLTANIMIDNQPVLTYISGFLDPFARFLGLDGSILFAFILAAPANEIVFPIIIMTYMAEGSIIEIGDLSFLKELLISNGWTHITAVCFMLFSLLHWPCSTTLITIKKETRSIKWCIVAFIIPTLVSIAACLLFSTIANALSL